MIDLNISQRDLDLVIDALVHRQEALFDISAFSINPLAIKIRIKELDKLLTVLRRTRNEKTQSLPR